MNFKDIITGPIPTHVIPAELLRPSFYKMLFSYYFCLVLYGITAIIVGLPTLAATTNGHFSFYWAVSITALGFIASLGVLLSRHLKREWIEVFATCLIVGLLAGYSVAIGARAFTLGHINTLASVWLPILIAILPTWRLAMISIEGNLFHKRRAKE
jgi:hypothetical protein